MSGVPGPGPTIVPAPKPSSVSSLAPCLAPEESSNDEYIKTPKTSILIPPIVWSALDYYEAFEKTPENHGDGCNHRGDGVDVKLTQDSTCSLWDGSQYFVGWWDPGEYLLYRFSIPSGSSGNYDIGVRVASKKKGKDIQMILMSADRTSIMQSKVLEVPDSGWKKFDDVVWGSVYLKADEYTLKVISMTGSVNLCFTSITATDSNTDPDSDQDFDHNIEVPGYYNAMHYVNAEFFDTTSEHLGNCPYMKSTPVDAQINNDSICKTAISKYEKHCHVAFTEKNEFLIYNFRKVATQTKVRVSLRVASKSRRKILVVLNSLDMTNGYFSRVTKVVAAPGNDIKSWDIYNTLVVWDEIDIGTAEKYSLKIVFLDGRTNLCAIGIDYVSLVL